MHMKKGIMFLYLERVALNNVSGFSSHCVILNPEYLISGYSILFNFFAYLHQEHLYVRK